MAYGTIIPSEYAADAPLTSTLAERWSENLGAVINGEISAPRIKLAALDSGFITGGGIGSYVFATCSADTAINGIVAGSSLNPASASWQTIANVFSAGTYSLSRGGALTGSWKCMGNYDTQGGNSNISLHGATLWLRIA